LAAVIVNAPVADVAGETVTAVPHAGAAAAENPVVLFACVAVTETVCVSAPNAIAAGVADAALEAPKELVYAICSAPGVAGAGVAVAGVDGALLLLPPQAARAATKTAAKTAEQSFAKRMGPPEKSRRANAWHGLNHRMRLLKEN